MSEHLRKSIEELAGRLRKQEDEVADTKRAINALCKALGDPPRYASIEPERVQTLTIRPDSFYGRPFATAVEDILRVKGHAVPVAEIVQTLKDGGYDFEKKDPNRVVPISLAKNSAKFVGIPNTDSFGLKEWYPEMKKRPKKESDIIDDNGNDTVNSTEEENGGEKGE